MTKYSRAYHDVDTEKILDIIEAVLPEEFRVYATFEFDRPDPYLGLPPWCDFETHKPDDIYQKIDAAKLSGAWKKALKAVVDAYIEDLEDADFVIDD